MGRILDRRLYETLNLQRELRGLPRLGRRELARLVGLASAGGLSSALLEACVRADPAPPGAAAVGGAPGSVAAGSGSPGLPTPDVPIAGRLDPASGRAGMDAAAQSSAAPMGGSPAPAGGAPATAGSSAPTPATAPPDPPNTPACPDCARVGLARNSDIAKAVQTAVELAGGLGAIKPGQKVVIKPNITGTSKDFITHPEVIRGIILAVATRTEPKNITIAECTALGANTRSNARTTGVLPLVEEMGANFLCFDEGNYVSFRDAKWKHITDEKRVPESLRNGQFDHFINAPILKNHTVGNAGYTCCFKNFVGLLPYSGSGSRMSSNIHTADIAEKAAELGLIVPTITMNIVDATTPGLVDGPTPTTIADAGGLILASTDRVACDSVAVAILKCYAKKLNVTGSYVGKSVFAQPQIVRAAELGLGISDPQRIQIRAQDVDNLADIMAQWV